MLQHKRKVLDSQIAVLQLELKADEQESQLLIAQEKVKLMKCQKDQLEIAHSRFEKKGSFGANGKNRATPGEQI